MRVVLCSMISLINIGICSAANFDIYVPAEEALVIDSDTGEKIRYFDAVFQFNETTFHLWECHANNKHGSELSLLQIEDIKQLRFIFKDSDHVTVIDDREMVSNFIKYLKFGRPHPSFNCIDFCTTLTKSFVKINFIPWKLVPSKEEEFEVSDVIAISHADESLKDNSKVFAHFAFYIGQGKYFSVYGCRGGIYVTTLEQMRAYWKGGTLNRRENKG